MKSQPDLVDTEKASFVLLRHNSGYCIRDQRYKEDLFSESISRTDRKMLTDRVVYTFDHCKHIITKEKDLYVIELLYNTEKKLGNVNSIKYDLVFLCNELKSRHSGISESSLRKKLHSYLKSIKCHTITYCAFLKFNLDLLHDEDSKHYSQVLQELIEDNQCTYNDVKIAEKVLLNGVIN